MLPLPRISNMHHGSLKVLIAATNVTPQDEIEFVQGHCAIIVLLLSMERERDRKRDMWREGEREGGREGESERH